MIQERVICPISSWLIAGNKPSATRMHFALGRTEVAWLELQKRLLLLRGAGFPEKSGVILWSSGNVT